MVITALIKLYDPFRRMEIKHNSAHLSKSASTVVTGGILICLVAQGINEWSIFVCQKCWTFYIYFILG